VIPPPQASSLLAHGFIGSNPFFYWQNFTKKKKKFNENFENEVFFGGLNHHSQINK
jgi:hypothetical protein